MSDWTYNSSGVDKFSPCSQKTEVWSPVRFKKLEPMLFSWRRNEVHVNGKMESAGCCATDWVFRENMMSVCGAWRTTLQESQVSVQNVCFSKFSQYYDAAQNIYDKSSMSITRTNRSRKGYQFSLFPQIIQSINCYLNSRSVMHYGIVTLSRGSYHVKD